MQNVNGIDCQSCANKKNSIFCSIAAKTLSEISHHKLMFTHKKGYTLFHQGNPPFGIYCINQGKIKISKYGSDGKESIVRISGPGDVLGHRSFFSKDCYSATATVIEDASVCFLDKDTVHKCLRLEPSMALNLIHKLSKDMGAAEARSAAMVQKCVSARLAEVLLIIKKNFGIKENNRFRLDIKLTREELASLVGTANETVIRFVSEFKDLGVIEQEGKTLFILDEKKLAEMANMTPAQK